MAVPIHTFRRDFIKQSSAALGAAALSSCPAPSSRPNIVLIVADDLGFADIGIQGAPDIDTPNIDRLGINGIQFTRAYAGGAICAPSRSALLSGRYAAMLGQYYNPPDGQEPPGWGLPLDVMNLGEFFTAEGYATGYIGKWHQGISPVQHPNVRGYAYFAGSTGRPRHLMQPFEGDPIHFQTQINGTIVTERAYVTEFYATQAVEFVRRNQATPFFLHWSDFAPHKPFASDTAWNVPQAYLDRVAHIEDPARRGYAATITALDDGVGRLLTELESLNILNNTFIIFTNDNGGEEAFASSGPYRGGKASPYEGGVRVPMLWHWPDRISTPDILSFPIHHVDLWPTLGALASPSRVRQAIDIDGVDLSPFVFGRRGGSTPHERLFWSPVPSQGLIWEGPWKLYRSDRYDTFELYNLEDDPSESRNLAQRLSDVVAQLSATLADWRTGIAAPQWEPSAKADWPGTQDLLYLRDDQG